MASKTSVLKALEYILRCILLLTSPVYADTLSEQHTQLQNITTQIAALDAQLLTDQAQQTQLQDNLRALDIQIDQLAKKLQETQLAVAENERVLTTLDQQYAKDLKGLQQEQDLLREQVRSTFLFGRNQNLKLWLSQTDPQVLSRLLTYFDYLNAARGELMQGLQTELNNLIQIQAQRKAQQATLQQLQIQQQQDYGQLAEQTQAQSSLVAELLAHMEEKNLTLASLRADKKALGSLITQLAAQPSAIFVGDTGKPIADHQGKLAWPVTGKVLHRFGEVYAGDNTWQGILIAAPMGTPVRAIYAGQVVYADWLRGLGLIVIVDHGNDYMSLYAHNQSLYKNVGDSVAANEPIAAVGKSGSVSDSGLYFEMRFKGQVQNPASWLMPISS